MTNSIDQLQAQSHRIEAQIRSARRQPSGVTRRCITGKIATQRELMGAFACPRSGRAPQGASNFRGTRKLPLWRLKIIWLWEGRSRGSHYQVSFRRVVVVSAKQRLTTTGRSAA